jgi:hypothetical protein
MIRYPVFIVFLEKPQEAIREKYSKTFSVLGGSKTGFRETRIEPVLWSRGLIVFDYPTNRLKVYSIHYSNSFSTRINIVFPKITPSRLISLKAR